MSQERKNKLKMTYAQVWSRCQQMPRPLAKLREGHRHWQLKQTRPQGSCILGRGACVHHHAQPTLSFCLPLDRISQGIKAGL